MDELQEFAELEKRLRRELGHVDAPAGFAERVMRRVEATDAAGEKAPFGSAHRRSASSWSGSYRGAAGLRHRGWWSGVVATAIAAGIFAGVRVHEVRRAELAQQQFDSAMRVTAQALEKTREQLQRVGVQLDRSKGEAE